MFAVTDAVGEAEGISTVVAPGSQTVQFFSAAQAAGRYLNGTSPMPCTKLSSARVTSAGFRINTLSNLVNTQGMVQVLYNRLPYLPSFPYAEGMFKDARCKSYPLNKLMAAETAV